MNIDDAPATVQLHEVLKRLEGKRLTLILKSGKNFDGVLEIPPFSKLICINSSLSFEGKILKLSHVISIEEVAGFTNLLEVL